MSASESFDQEEYSFPFNDFDAYLQPAHPEQVDEHAQFTALPDAHPSDQIGQIGPEVFAEHPDHSISSMMQGPMAERSVYPRPGNLQGGVASTLDFEGFSDVPVADGSNPNPMEQSYNYGPSQDFPIPTATQPPLPLLPQYPPVPIMGEGAYGPLYPREIMLPSHPGSQMLMETTVGMPQLLPIAKDVEKMAFQDTVPHEVPSVAQVPPDPSVSCSSTRKRKAFGPTNDVRLPPIKKGGSRRPMPPEKREERKETKQKGVCITCRMRKKKCDGEIPCNLCRKNLDMRIRRNPCTKAQFFDIVEFKPCYAFSALYESISLEKFDNQSLAEHFVLATILYCDGELLEVKYAAPLPARVISSWSQIFLPFLWHPEFVNYFAKQGLEPSFDALPNLLPIIAKAPNLLCKKCIGDESGFAFEFLPDGTTPQTGIAMEQLSLCKMICHGFTLAHATANRTPITSGPIYESARLLLWLLARQCEIHLFRYLQNSVNKLDFLPSSELGPITLCLLKSIVSLRPRLEDFARELYPGKQIALDREMVRQLEDRQNRLRMALLVYASIACSKLPSWSDFWPELEKTTIFTQKEFRKILADPYSFDSEVKTKTAPLNSGLKRVANRVRVWEELDPDSFSSPPSELPELSSHSLLGLYRDLQNGVIDETTHKYDMYFTGGLLSATVSGSFAEVRAWKFSVIAKLDWVQAFSNLSQSEMCSDLSDFGLSHIAIKLRYRTQLVELCDLLKSAITERGLSTARSIHCLLVSALSETSNEGNPCGEDQKEVFLRLRAGLRWGELKQLAGEEVFLLQNVTRTGYEIQSLDVPFIISNGSEADFSRLKRLLLTSQSWLRETCLHLKGLVQWFKEAMGVVETDRNAALDLARQIQERVFSVFGNREFLDEVLERQVLDFPHGFSENDPDALKEILSGILAAREQKMTEDSQDSGMDGLEEEREEEEEPREGELEELRRNTEALLEASLEL